jgi:GTP diphosphokinase / guanosine-3',5'-bis(diphosphate) 3'-diphosphatase
MCTDVSTTDYEQAAAQLWSYLLPNLSYLDNKELEQVELAFMQMVSAHTGQQRKTGDFYIIHPVEACVFLTHMGLDADTLSACLLHDVPEDTEVGLEELSKHFSQDVVFLISGITKLSKIKYRGEDRYAENLRKMFVAMSRDLRVIFIKLADRLHNLQTLDALAPEKAKRIALESLEIYVPIAQKLGINYFKGRIEDEAFKYVYPEEYKQFISQSTTEIERRKDVVTRMKTLIESLLQENAIHEFTLKGRAKKYYSMYRKTQEKISH